MMKRLLVMYVCVAMMSMFIQSTSFAQKNVIYKVKTIEEVVFGENKLNDGTIIERVMDMHIPVADTKEKRPALVFIHGNPGDKPYPGNRHHGFREYTDYFTARGYVCFVISWDLRQGHGAAVPQVEMAVKHIRVEAEKYGIDPLRIGAIGHSYGGSHAGTLATANFIDEQARVQVAILMAGGIHYPEDCEESDAPILSEYGTEDKWFKKSPGLPEKMQSRNLRHAYFQLEGAKHSIPPDTPYDFGMTKIDVMEDFLAMHLLGKKDTKLKMLTVVREGRGKVKLGSGASYGLYPAGTTVTARAVADPGYRFVRWAGTSTADRSEIDVTMDSNKKLVAHFEKK